MNSLMNLKDGNHPLAPKLEKTMNHPAIAKAGFKSPVHAIVQGSSLQRTIIASKFEVKDTFNFPTIHQLSKSFPPEKMYSLVVGVVLNVCQYYGVQLQGDKDEAGYLLCEKYPDFTPLDWILFSKMAKEGEFADKFQTLQKAVSIHYVQQWIREYIKLKEQARENIEQNKKHKANEDLATALANKINFESFAASQAKYKRLKELEYTLQLQAEKKPTKQQFLDFWNNEFIGLSLDKHEILRNQYWNDIEKFAKAEKAKHEEATGGEYSLKACLASAYRNLLGVFPFNNVRLEVSDYVWMCFAHFKKKNTDYPKSRFYFALTGLEKNLEGRDTTYFVASIAKVLRDKFKKDYQEYREIQLESSVLPMPEKHWVALQTRKYFKDKVGYCFAEQVISALQTEQNQRV